MQTNTYYQTMYRRQNFIKDALLNFFLGLSSWPRMLLETMIRVRFGQRYFSFSGTVAVALLMALYPIYSVYGFHPFSHYGYSHSVDMAEFIKRYFTWYVYLIGFIYLADERHEEIKRLPGVFDFAHFSLSTGYIHSKFWAIVIGGQSVDRRTIETLLEPGFFFAIGLSLWMFGQPLGTLLIVCSIIYSLSYIAAYSQGDDFLMDKIDIHIVNEELGRSFIEERGTRETRGFNFMGHRPADSEARRRVAAMFSADEEIAEAR